MVKTKQKGILSVLLALVMLVGVAALVATVFTPKADAATAGSYNIRITYDVGDQNNSGTTTLYVWYKPNNGTGTETSTSFSVDDINNNTGSNRTSTFTVAGFPTKMKLRLQQGGMRTQNATIKKGEIGSTSNTNWQTGWSGSVKVDPGWWGDKDSGELSLGSAETPHPVIGAITGEDSFTIGLNPSSNVQSAYTTTAIKDQYGVNWYQDPQWKIENDGWSGVSVTSSNSGLTGTVTIPKTSANGCQTFKLTAYRGSYSNSKTITVYPTYSVTFDTSTNRATSNSGTETYASTSVVNSNVGSTAATYTIPANNKPANHDGWVFNGWTTGAGYTSGIIPNGSNTIAVEGYDGILYATYKKDLKIRYHYYSATGATYKDVSTTIYNKTNSGTINASTVGLTANTSTVTYNNVEYTFLGWTKSTTNSSSGLSSNGSYAVQASETSIDVYAVYSTNNTGHLYYYNENGLRVTKDVTGDDVIVNVGNTNKPTQASFTLPTVNQTTATIDGKTFTFVGWRADNTDVALKDKNVGDVETRNFKKAGYNYYAVYSGDVTVSYNLNERYNDGTDTVTGTVPANKTTQYAVANTAAAANALKNSPAIAVNPDNVQLTRVGADQFLGWAIVPNGEDTESETAAYPVTLAADAAGALTINADTTLTAIFKDSRKTVKAVYPNGADVAAAQTIRYNYGGRLPYLDKKALGPQTDGSNHYFFNGWSQNNDLTNLVKTEEADGETLKDYYDFSRVKDNVTFTATYTGQSHHWEQDDLAGAAISCNGVAGEGHAFTNGGYHRYCTECHYGESDTAGNYSPNTYVTMEAEDSDYIMIVNNRPPTCTAKGSTGKQQCKLCFKTIKEAVDVTPLGVLNEHTGRYEHNLQPVAAPEGATYTLKRCTVCGHEERYYNADEHSLVYIAQRDATCTEEGYTVDHFFCTDEGCGKRFADVEAKTEIVETVVIPALGHDYQYAVEVPATCTTDGHADGYVCTRCGELQDPAIFLPATGHDPAQFETEEGKPATCQSAGREDYTKCRVCGTIISGGDVIPQLEHKLSGIRVVIPTCTEGGKSYRYCENPGCDVDAETEGDQPYEIVTSTPAALGHDMRLVPGKAATCTEAGVKDYYECNRCHRITSDAAGNSVIENIDEWKVIDALGHEMGEPETVNPSCTEAGYTITKCTREGCTYSEREEGAPATGHSGGTATCQTKAICDVCGKPYGNYAGHTWDNGTVTEGDCQHRGYTTYACTTPGCTSTKKENGSFGEHDYWVVSQTQPTCTEQGDVVKRCQVCGDETHAYTDALGHNVTEWHMDGTVAKGVCSRCGQEVTTSPSEAGLAHKCDKCGLVHEGRTGIFVQDGFYCKLIGFFRKILHMFG